MSIPRYAGRRALAASASAALLFTAAPAILPASTGAVDAAAAKTTPATSSSATSATATSASATSSSTTSATESRTETPAESPGDAAADAVPAPTTDVGREIRERMDAATEAVEDDGGEIGMAFLDRKTGELVCNESCLESFALASLSKVFVAEVVGYTNYTPVGRKGEITRGEGDMPVAGNGDAMLRDDMVRYSDNEATDALWSRYGRTKIIDDVKERYGLSEATEADPDWGMTLTSPADMVAFFDGLLSGDGGLSDVETRYLTQLMYSVPRYSYGDADQNTGLRAALPDEFVGVKGGWYDPEIRTSAGFFGEDDRYVMAVLAGNVTPDAFTEAIAAVFPEGGATIAERGDEATIQAGHAAGIGAEDASSMGWMAALLVATAGAFSLGWWMRRAG